MAVNDLVFTIKDLDDTVKLGTAMELGFEEGGAMTLDEFWLDFFHHRMLARMVKPAMKKFITSVERAALDTAEETAEATTQSINVTIS